MPDPQEIKPRPVGRPAGESQFARGLSALTPNDKALLLKLWLSGRYPTKMALAEDVGLQYDSLRHLASDEKWPTEAELRREITDVAVAAVRKLRETKIEEVLEESVASYKRMGKILGRALDDFEESGALVSIDSETGEKIYSKRRVSDLKGLMETVKTHHKIIGDLVGLAELQKERKNEGKVSVSGNKIQLNILTQGGGPR